MRRVFRLSLEHARPVMYICLAVLCYWFCWRDMYQVESSAHKAFLISDVWIRMLLAPRGFYNVCHPSLDLERRASIIVAQTHHLTGSGIHMVFDALSADVRAHLSSKIMRILRPLARIPSPDPA